MFQESEVSQPPKVESEVGKTEVRWKFSRPPVCHRCAPVGVRFTCLVSPPPSRGAVAVVGDAGFD